MQWISIGFIALLVASPTFAATIRVGVGPSADFKTIQDAVDAAKNGDVINVDAAEYNEQVTIHGKNITIKATGAGDPLIPLPSIAPNNLVPNAQTADGREISALLVVENAWVEIRNLRIAGGRITSTKRRAADIFVGIVMLGENSGLDVQDSIIRGINKAGITLPRVVDFPTDCVGDIRNPDRGVGILALDGLSLAVTNSDINTNVDGVTAVCVRDFSLQSNTIVGTGMANQGIGTTVAANAARIVKNKFGGNLIDVLIKGDDNRIFQNGSANPDLISSNIGIEIDGDWNVLFGNFMSHANTKLLNLGSDNVVTTPRGRLRH